MVMYTSMTWLRLLSEIFKNRSLPIKMDTDAMEQDSSGAHTAISQALETPSQFPTTTNNANSTSALNASSII